jgi:hypothetical protein
MTSSSLDYRNMYVCLVDILGFSEFILQKSDSHRVETITKLYNEIAEAAGSAHLAETKISISLFSDTIVLSVASPEIEESDGAVDEIEIDDLLGPYLWTIRRVALILLRNGFLCRGCIIFGKCFHQDGLLLGPAVVQAHRFEQHVATYPRIIMVESVRETVAGSAKLKKWMRYSDDGPAYLHILYDLERFASDINNLGRKEAQGHESFGIIVQSHKTVQRFLQQTRDKPLYFC